MTATTPCCWIADGKKTRVLMCCILLSVLVLTALQIIDRHLVTEQSPHGIVSFELAGEYTQSQKILDSWAPETRIYAALSLGLDYLFLALYPLTIALGCTIVSTKIKQRSGALTVIGVVLARAQVGALILDSIENYSLLQLLLGSQQDAWSVVAKLSAIPKFFIALSGLVYVLAGLFFWVIRRCKGRLDKGFSGLWS